MNSTAATRAAESTTTRMIPPRSLVNHFGSTEKQTFSLSRMWFDRGPDIGPHNLAKWLLSVTSSVTSSVTLRKKRETLRKRFRTTMESKDRKKHNPSRRWNPRSRSHRKSSSTHSTWCGRGQQARQHQRRGEGDRRPRLCRQPNRACSSTRFGVRLRDKGRDWQYSGGSSGICPRIFRLERLVRKQQRADLGGGQAHGVHQLLFPKEPPGLERRGDVGKILLLLSDFSMMKRRRMTRSLLSLRREKKSGQAS